MITIFKYLFSLPKIILFNFYYLPLKQAVKLPILLYNVKLKLMRGKVIIDNERIRTGMIKLGPEINSLYLTNKSKLIWENQGICKFKGTCVVGHNSAITIGRNGLLEFGENFFANTTLRLACFKSITFGDNARVSWDVLIADSDFHETVEVDTGKRSIPSKDIKIGKNNWIGIRTTILKGTITPDFCIVGANSLLNKYYEIPQYSLIAGIPAKLIKTGIYRDLNSYIK